MKPLVSVITCCYNGERFIDRWAESLLKQTYDRIEILFVNDGSRDESEIKALNYKEVFEVRGYKIKYFHQQNTGIGGATNVGLLHMTGDYFMVYDIDDILYENCIEIRVEYLENNNDCGLVLTNGHYAHESNLDAKVPVEYYSPNITAMKDEKEYIFEDIILGERVCCTCPYMHRTSYYLKANPMRTIYPTRYQQDTQITMISSYNYKCGYIEEPQYILVGRDDSHSHSMKKEKNIDEVIAYSKSTKLAKVKTLEILPINCRMRKKYEKVVEENYLNDLNRILVDIKIQENERNVLPDEIVIFGAGKIGEKVSRIARYLGVKVEGFLDNNKLKIGGEIKGVEIRGLSSVNYEELKNRYIVIASKLKHDDICNQLEEIGLRYKIDFCDYRDFLRICKERLVLHIGLIDSML